MSAEIQSGASPRSSTELTLEGGPEEGAQAVLRAEQARSTDDRLLRRERFHSVEGFVLEEHSSDRVRLFLNVPFTDFR